VHPLDNPVWHALTGPQKTVAQGNGLALRYDPAFAPFAAMPDARSVESWAALGELVGAGGVAVLVGDVAPAEGWSEAFRISTLQMVATDAEAGPEEGLVALGPADVDAMLALVGRTNPGPFAARTVELGDYLGVRDDDGGLVAMAGTRMRVDGFTEISAVCTDASHRGSGLGTRLVLALVGRIQARGEVACLHVMRENLGAIRLYEALGFTTRREGDVVGLRAPA
jgi:ribosomal protein S18 acetylase RimI-like enzyme